MAALAIAALLAAYIAGLIYEAGNRF